MGRHRAREDAGMLHHHSRVSAIIVDTPDCCQHVFNARDDYWSCRSHTPTAPPDQVTEAIQKRLAAEQNRYETAVDI
jgi:hypothetical protein